MNAVIKQVYIISDIHLGGEYPKNGNKGFRMCNQVEKLTQFVTALAEKPQSPKIELVINGDFVDFLAEEPPYWTAFTENSIWAIEKLELITKRDIYFFTALKTFLHKGHRLTILLGNHDLELSLPAVRKKLEKILGIEGTQDYHFIYDNEAYVVGKVLIEHGNRYDRWNMVDHDALRHVRSLQSR